MVVPTMAWIFGKRNPAGVLTAIYVAAEAGSPMVRRQSAEVLAGKGLGGDRYAEGRGFYQSVDACQITMIDGDELARIQRRTGIALTDGEHRRNLVVSGIPLKRLSGGRIRVGSVVFEYHKPRPPCGYLESITEPGIAKALGRASGICVRAVSDGVIEVGDAVVFQS